MRDKSLERAQVMRSLIRILTFFIPCQRLRKQVRQGLICWWYSFPVRQKASKVGKGFRTDAPSVVTATTSIGDGVMGHGFRIHGGGRVEIGNHVQMGMELLILAQNHNYEGERLPFDYDYTFKDVLVGDSVWIGAQVTILPGTTIGEGAIIQAGSVVHGKIPPCAIAGGNPAKVFGWRDKAHYERLKAEGMFV